jgi:hypothetical protein
MRDRGDFVEPEQAVFGHGRTCTETSRRIDTLIVIRHQQMERKTGRIMHDHYTLAGVVAGLDRKTCVVRRGAVDLVDPLLEIAQIEHLARHSGKNRIGPDMVVRIVFDPVTLNHALDHRDRQLARGEILCR